MRLYSVRFSVLACSLFLFFMGGISFAKPGDYLVYSLDPKKDSSLKCCCCGDAFSKTYYPRLCFLKYEKGGDMKSVFEEAKKFNLSEAEKLKSKFFDDIKTGDYCSVVKKFKETLAKMKGLFCSSCMKVAFEVAGTFEWREFLANDVKSRTHGYNFLSSCHVCGKKLNPYNHVSFCCVKCGVYSYCNAQCYQEDKDKDSCPVCDNKLKSGNKEAIRRIPYLYDHDIQRTDDTGTEVKIHMNCGLSAGRRNIFNYNGTKFVIGYFFVIHGSCFEREFPFKCIKCNGIYGQKVPLSDEEKEGCYDIPGKDDSKFYFICHVRSSNGFGLNENSEFTKTSRKMCRIYDKRWGGFGWHSNQVVNEELLCNCHQTNKTVNKPETDGSDTDEEI